MRSPFKMTKSIAKDLWIQAQCLDQEAPFGTGPKAVPKAISHLGYVQIDTINVIERCHHHILYTRIPDYKPDYLRTAQTKDKTTFEYWTHALSYVHTDDFRYFVHKMNNTKSMLGSWLSSVSEADYKKVKSLLKKQGAISIRDIKDDVLIEKTHLWGSAKPSKKALQLGFFKGEFVVAERDGMLKRYDLAERHFGWKAKPKPVEESVYGNYILERALKSQGLVSLDSICYLEPKLKKVVYALILQKIKQKKLASVVVKGHEKMMYYARPEVLQRDVVVSERTHILSPFDPLVIQRKRLKMFFDYEHLFEAYVPQQKRKFGYFALPVLHQNKIIALLDLKTDRQKNKVLIQNWIWLGKNKSALHKALIEKELDRFECFQLQSSHKKACFNTNRHAPIE